MNPPPGPPLPESVHFPAPGGPLGIPCPNCAGQATRAVYEVRGIPIHSCVLLESAERARAFPTGDLVWATCADCTFLFNARFDAGLIDYSSDYEETQGFSRTFSTWLEGVARGLVEDFDLRGKRIVEIGCGRGDFLELVCRLGGNEGTGVDPSETAGRVDLGAGKGLRFLRESYGAAHLDLGADAILCRHTLEHIHEPRPLLELVRAGLRDGGIAFFEVPDVGRQLAEGAFWDVYYEHCSYFSEPSLRALFESTGFRVERIEKVYGDQYLQIVARRAEAPRTETSLPEDVRREWSAAVEAFAQTCRSSLEAWRRFQTEREADGASAVLWGSGSKATGFLTTLGWGTQVLERVVDINPDKWGRFVAGTGQEIVPPPSLADAPPDHVVVMNPIYLEEIGADLESFGCRPQLHALGRENE